MFDDATRVLCDRYGLDRSSVVSRARAFEAKPVGDRAGVSAQDEIEDRTGAPVARFEVARRVFWTALGDACEREDVARGWADAAISSADHDHVVLERVRRAALQDVSLAVRGCDRVLDLSVERTWGAIRPSGAVERSVADVVADRLLSNVGGPEPRMNLDQRDGPRVREILGRLAGAARPSDAVLANVAAGFAVGGDRDDATVLEVVRDRAEAVTEFMLDPSRAWRSDRMGDVEHSRSATPWRDLECARAWRASGVEPESGGARHGSRPRRAAVPLVIQCRESLDGVTAGPASARVAAPRFALECPAGAGRLRGRLSA